MCVCVCVAENRQLLHEQAVEQVLVELLCVENDSVRIASCQAVAAMSLSMTSRDTFRHLGETHTHTHRDTFRHLGETHTHTHTETPADTWVRHTQIGINTNTTPVPVAVEGARMLHEYAHLGVFQMASAQWLRCYAMRAPR